MHNEQYQGMRPFTIHVISLCIISLQLTEILDTKGLPPNGPFAWGSTSRRRGNRARAIKKTFSRPELNRGPSPRQGDVITATLREMNFLIEHGENMIYKQTNCLELSPLQASLLAGVGAPRQAGPRASTSQCAGAALTAPFRVASGKCVIFDDPTASAPPWAPAPRSITRSRRGRTGRS